MTRPANEQVARVHARMPQIIAPHSWQGYLAEDPDIAAATLQPVAAAQVAAWPVSRAVNRPGYDDPSCIAPAAS